MDMYPEYCYQDNQMMVMQSMQMQQQNYYYNQMGQWTQNQKSVSNCKSKRSYVQCELWKRQSLVQKVEKEGLTIKDAARELDINYSTAKHIMKVYRQTGEVETKIMMKRKTKDTTSLESYGDNNFDFVPQVSQNQIHEVQPTYFNTGYSQCQLPIVGNMKDEAFIPEKYSNESSFIFNAEEKHNIKLFFFGQESENQ